MKFKLAFLLSFIGFFASGQISEKILSDLRKELINEINQERISVELVPLETNSVLKKAAKIQSIYMSRTGSLTHSQVKPEVATPTKRVKFFKGFEFVLVGENVLFSANFTPPLNKLKVQKLAKEMFLSWKNSPDHYANMIKPEFDFGDIDFQFEPKSKRIYATHVFGKKGTKIKGQLSSNAFEIQEGDLDCNGAFGAFQNIVTNMGNAIHVEGNRIMFYYHNINYFNKIFSGAKDGMAVDLIFRSQVDCSTFNEFDYSPIYDGILLPPIYREEILRRNVAESKFRIISELGTIPDSLLDKEFSCSVVLIRDGKKCKYLIPGEVPAKRYELRTMKPKLLNPGVFDLRTKGIVFSQEIQYDFKTNNTEPIEYPTFDKMLGTIHSIDIKCYSSVEGSFEKNSKLHNQRAISIKKHLSNKLKVNNSKIAVEAKENWEKMYFQLRYFMANDLADLPKEELRKVLLEENHRLSWDSLFFSQRRSTATIHYLGELSGISNEDKILEMNFRTALLEKDFNYANKILYKMYESNKFPDGLLFEKSIFDMIFQSKELVQNIAALLTKTYEKNAIKTIEFLFHWMRNSRSLTKEAQYNLLILYTLISFDMLDKWDLSSKRLSNVVHPNIVQNIFGEDLESKLALNLNLTFIRYFGQINDGTNISKSFEFITNYFESRSLNIEDEIDLALFFNSWSRYDLTNKMLLDNISEVELNEKAIFILIKTLNFYRKGNQEIDLYEDEFLKAFEINPIKWCNWVDNNFQILRIPFVKELFCDNCSQ